MAVSRMRSEKYAIKRSFMAESPKFLHPIGNQGRGTRWWRQILNRKWKYDRFAHAQYKIRCITHIYGGMSEIHASYRKSVSRNMMVTSDFRPEVEIWPFRACAVKKAIKRSFMAESPKFSRLLGRTRWWRQILDRKCTNGRFAHVQYKIRYITFIYSGMSEILASYKKPGSRNMKVTSYFRPEVEIWPFRACAVKNTL